MGFCRTRCALDYFFFFNDTATTEIYTLSLHDALPISSGTASAACCDRSCSPSVSMGRDRKSTRLNSSHMSNSYAVFCLKKKNSAIAHAELNAEIHYETDEQNREGDGDQIERTYHSQDDRGGDRKTDDQAYFFFNDTATTEIYTLSLRDALPIWVNDVCTIVETGGIKLIFSDGAASRPA